MRKTISILLMMIFVLSLTGCGGRKKDTESPKTNDMYFYVLLLFVCASVYTSPLVKFE